MCDKLFSSYFKFDETRIYQNNTCLEVRFSRGWRDSIICEIKKLKKNQKRRGNYTFPNFVLWRWDFAWIAIPTHCQCGGWRGKQKRRPWNKDSWSCWKSSFAILANEKVSPPLFFVFFYVWVKKVAKKAPVTGRKFCHACKREAPPPLLFLLALWSLPWSIKLRKKKKRLCVYDNNLLLYVGHSWIAFQFSFLITTSVCLKLIYKNRYKTS